MISGFRCEVADNCALVGFYAVINSISSSKITTTHCIIIQKSAVLYIV